MTSQTKWSIDQAHSEIELTNTGQKELTMKLETLASKEGILLSNKRLFLSNLETMKNNIIKL